MSQLMITVNYRVREEEVVEREKIVRQKEAAAE